MAPGTWTNSHTKLCDLLAQWYLDRASAQRIVEEALMDPTNVTFSDRSADTWHSIIKEADSQGKLVPLIEVAKGPSANEALEELLEVFKRRGKTPGSTGVQRESSRSISDVELRNFIRDHFDTNGINDLSFGLEEALRRAGKIPDNAPFNIGTFSSENLPRSTIALDLVRYFRSRAWTPFLIAAVQDARPDAFREMFGE